MSPKKEYEFAEVLYDNLILEKFSEQSSPYYLTDDEKLKKDAYQKFKRKLTWHVNNTLTGRQKEVIKLILEGKTQRQIAKILGITQQVVFIYKSRAISKLKEKL